MNRPHPAPRIRHFAFAIGMASILLLSAQAVTAQSLRTEYGSLDAYSNEGLSLAWAILKAEAGQGPENDCILLRIVMRDGSTPALLVSGVDPFTGDRKQLSTVKGPGPSTELRLPRSHFADYPRTEILFSDLGWMIYYFGIPDTTPEFLDEAKMEVYLAARLSAAK